MTGPAQASTPTQSIVIYRRWAQVIVAMFLLLLLAACEPLVSGETVLEGGEATSPVQAPAESDRAEDATPLAPDAAAPPVRLVIADIGLDAPVTPMGWRVVTLDGERTTSWDVPLDSVGWHTNSAGAGAAGNVLLSGRQADGEALLEPLALRSVTPGQEVRLTDENGLEFVYRVREVSEPIPISGASEEETARALAFVTVTDVEAAGGVQLTLIAGWPEFTTTHRVFAVADLVAAPN